MAGSSICQRAAAVVSGALCLSEVGKDVQAAGREVPRRQIQLCRALGRTVAEAAVRSLRARAGAGKAVAGSNAHLLLALLADLIDTSLGREGDLGFLEAWLH